MGGLAGDGRQLVVAQGIEFVQSAFAEDVEELLVPLGIERVQRVLVVHEALGSGDHPLLARLAFVGRQVAAAAHQPVGHAGIDFGQFRHRRLVR
ncbi:hypothetical protein D3C81_1787950 [compost metagenome]